MAFHAATPTAPEETRGRELFRILSAAAALTVAGALAAAVLAPPDAVQGQWQRLMYVHVPAAWLAYLCFAGVLGACVMDLRRPSRGSVRWATAAAEVGVAATAVTLVSGSVWGRGVWGVWWTWDARLVSTAVMFLLYLAYVALLRTDADAGQVRRRTAVFGCAAFVIVPVVHFSVLWWHTLHQRPTILDATSGPPPIDPRMALALSLAVVAVSVIGLLAVLLRVEALGRRARTSGRTSAAPAPVEEAAPATVRSR